MRARALAAVVASAGLLGAAAPASGALSWSFGEACEGSNFECARFTVPLDRSGSVPGTADLYVERSRPGEGAPSGVVIALAGGPGQGATTLTESFNRDLFGAIGPRDLVVFDQRGTGRSGVLSCPSLERPDDRPIDERTAECADLIGPSRAFYTTRDSVEDIEALRVALEVEQISLLGVSYGTKVAVAYAMAYPQRVERLVLDSVVDPLENDPFELDALASLPRVLGEVCREHCAAITPDLAADLAAVVDLMPLQATFVNGLGEREKKTITARELYSIVRAADLDPMARAEYPAAVRAAALGDPAPLVRLEHRYDDVPELEPPPGDELVRSLSFSLQAATLCEEEALPWSRSATPEQRDEQSAAAAAAIPDERFEPFSREVMLTRDANNLLFQCRRWPTPGPAPVLVDNGLPDVPVLVMAGLEDTRTTAEVASRVAARFPRAQYVAVPQAGHAVLGGRECAQQAVALFFADQTVGDICVGTHHGPLDPLPPRKIGDVGALDAVRMTLDDVSREHDRRLFGARRGGGLRAGYFAQRGRLIHIRAYSYVRKLAISGILRQGKKTGRIVVGGKVQGALRIKNGLLLGTLGGRRVAVQWKPPPTALLARSARARALRG